MDYFSFFSLIVLVTLLFLQIRRRYSDFDFFNITKKIFFFSIIGGFVYYGYLVYNQYFIWFYAGPPASFLLPPYESLWYVFSYHLGRFGLMYGVSLFVGLIFLAAAIRFNRKHGDLFFEKEEPYLGALAIFLAGTPGELYYFGGLITTYFILHLGLRMVRRTKEELRLPVYWLWLPLAILAIIIEIIFK
ncbi:MAG: hypothetical protein Q8L36_02275 [bacterium]|nr:hypothetical protein [bacterium]